MAGGKIIKVPRLLLRPKKRPLTRKKATAKIAKVVKRVLNNQMEKKFMIRPDAGSEQTQGYLSQFSLGTTTFSSGHLSAGGILAPTQGDGGYNERIGDSIQPKRLRVRHVIKVSAVGGVAMQDYVHDVVIAWVKVNVANPTSSVNIDQIWFSDQRLESGLYDAGYTIGNLYTSDMLFKRNPDYLKSYSVIGFKRLHIQNTLTSCDVITKSIEFNIDLSKHGKMNFGAGTSTATNYDYRFYVFCNVGNKGATTVTDAGMLAFIPEPTLGTYIGHSYNAQFDYTDA